MVNEATPEKFAFCSLNFLVAMFAWTTFASGQTPTTSPLVLKEEFRIGSEKNNLSRLDRVAVGPGGIIAVSQVQDHGYRFFLPDGAPGPTVGRKGAGPGEFSGAGEFGWDRGTFWAFDGTLNRLSLFEPSGRLIRTEPVGTQLTLSKLSAPKRYLSPLLRSVADGGRAVFQAVEVSEEEKAAPDSRHRALLLAGLDGAVERVLTEVPADQCSGRFKNAEVTFPLCPRTVLAVSNGAQRVIFVQTTDVSEGEVLIQARSLVTGVAIFSRKIRFPVRPLTKSSSDSIKQELAKLPQSVRDAFDHFRPALPRSWPVVRAVIPGEDGSIWVQLTRDAKKQSRSEWRYFGAGGEPLGWIMLPPGTRIVAAARGWMIAVETDDEDVENLVKYRVMP